VQHNGVQLRMNTNRPAPAAPGATLREMLHNRGLHPEAFAIATGISYDDLLSILDGKTGLTRDQAETFERILGVSADFWMRQQQEFRAHMVRNAILDPDKRKALAESMVSPVRGYVKRPTG